MKDKRSEAGSTHDSTEHSGVKPDAKSHESMVEQAIDSMGIDELTDWLKKQISRNHQPEGAGYRRPGRETSPTVKRAMGSALAFAQLALEDSEDVLYSLAEQMTPKLGELISMEELGFVSTRWAIYADVGTHTAGEGPADAARLAYWLTSVVELIETFPDLGATVTVGRGFISRYGPMGPVVSSLDAGILAVPGVCLIDSMAYELILAAPEAHTLHFPISPQHLAGSAIPLTRVSFKSASPPPICAEPPGCAMAEGPQTGETVGTEAMGTMGAKFSSGSRPWRDQARLSVVTGLPEDEFNFYRPSRGLAAPPRSGLVRRMPARTTSGRGVRRPNLSVSTVKSAGYRQRELRHRTERLPALGNSGEAAVERVGSGRVTRSEDPIRLKVRDALEVSIERQAQHFAYLLIQTNLKVHLEDAFSPVTADKQNVGCKVRFILGESARVLRVVTLTSDYALSNLDQVLRLVNAGRLEETDRTLDELGGIVAAFHPSVQISMTVSGSYEVRVEEESPAHPSVPKIKEMLGAGRYTDALNEIMLVFDGSMPPYQRATLSLLRGQVLRRLASHDEARRWLWEAAQSADVCMAPIIRAEALRELARSHIDRNTTGQARELLWQAQLISEQYGDLRGEVWTKFQECVLNFTEHRFEEALKGYRGLHRKALQLGNTKLQGACYGGEGEVLILLGRYKEAVEPLEKALELYRKSSDSLNILRVNADLGDLYLELGQTERALFEFEQVYFLASRRGKNIPPVLVALCRGRFGRALSEAGRHAEALEEISMACESLRQEKSARLSDVLVHLADVALKAGELEIAQSALDELGPLQPPLGLEVRWRGAKARGDLKIRRGEDGAEADYLLGIQALELGRGGLSQSLRSGYLESSVSLWNAFIELKLTEGHPLEMLRLVERMRARWFQDALIQQEPTTAMKRQDMLASCQWSDEAVDRVLHELPDDVTFLGFHCLAEQVVVLWVGRGQVQCKSIPVSLETLEGMCQAALDALSQPPRGGQDASGPLQALSDALLLPCRAWLATLPAGEPLGILAHGPLHRVPFHALPLGRVKALTFRNPVFYTPSLRASGYWLMAVKGPWEEEVVAFADPLENIDGACDEAHRFARTMGLSEEDERRVFCGPAANARNLVEAAPSSRYVHIATHAAQAEENLPAHFVMWPPEEVEWLRLSGEEGIMEPPDGRVGVDLVSRLGLRAEVVVLAACEGGAGEVSRSGEGPDLLSWAFLMGGARTVVSSGWRAQSGMTPEIMHRFYVNLRGGMNKAQALSRAQHQLYEDAQNREVGLDGEAINGQFVHPHYWACFSLTGDWQ